MTREEAKEKLYMEWQKFLEDNIDYAGISEAYKMAFKALKQEPKTGHNCNEDYADCDQFVCSECGIELQDWHRVERDEDDGDISYHDYVFRFCPNCGAKIEGEG